MTRTTERLTELATAVPGYRVRPDEEGWPHVRGKHGRLEHLGLGQLAAFTESTNLANRIAALPGVQRHQTGDGEYRVLVTGQAAPAVAKLFRCHRKRSGAAAHLAEHAYKSAVSAILAPREG
jgi:hypothetical protein